ncbi:MAG: response regulator [Clostridia bacterium]|nr:response regulator [Clostridia bacterium]
MHILIADDMPMQVRMLESHLRSVRPNDLIWTACSGTDALQIVQENQIDLFLSDIRMPQLDGLALLRQVRRISPTTKVVFITGYALFEYAREALQQGAADFLVKPVDFDELDTKIALLEKDMLQKKEETSLRLRQERQFALAKWRSEAYEELTEDEQAILRSDFHSGWMLEVYFPADGTPLLEPFCKDLDAFLGKACILLPQNRNQFRHAVIILQGEACRQEALLRYLQQWNSRQDMRMGLSSWQADLVAAGTLAQQLCHQAADLAFYDCKRVVQQCTLRMVSAPSLPASDDFFRMCSLLDDKHQDTMKEMLSLLHRQQPDVAQLLEQTVLCFVQVADLADIDFVDCRRNLASELRCVQTWDAYAVIFQRYAEEMHHKLMQLDIDPVQSCVKYLWQHYSDPLSLNDMAQRAHMSPSYFSSLFKKRVGSGFVDYLTEIRLESAAEALLKHRDATVNAIAEACGYVDARYFVRQFQKRYGMTPTLYRRKHSEKEPL